ncbi:hypothetical protein NDU88_000024 [Pleurodeles waltl]|uniref:Uncharacterized protein n=1 Tax=Pleurodeles waltl TaxID=8319 RepID=A0AAV7MQR4_PLEWA|nr:hypothetical protein NDU88_000024 [Pleurodeles waltl]
MLGGGADTPQYSRLWPRRIQKTARGRRKGPPRAPRPLTQAAASPAAQPGDPWRNKQWLEVYQRICNTWWWLDVHQRICNTGRVCRKVPSFLACVTEPKPLGHDKQSPGQDPVAEDTSSDTDPDVRLNASESENGRPRPERATEHGRREEQARHRRAKDREGRRSRKLSVERRPKHPQNHCRSSSRATVPATGSGAALHASGVTTALVQFFQ